MTSIIKSEIQYQKEDGTWAHSDIEPHGGCKFEDIDDKHREFLHRCLDEWIANSRGTGYFYIMNERYDLGS
jgi:hypothetical protein